MNEQKYWENRFASEEWKKYDGEGQTTYFADILLKHLPQWLKKVWEEKKYSFCDMGCAEGECAALLAEQFPNNLVFGVDFSPSAIQAAQKKYPKVKFLVDDIYQSSKNYDVIILSNVLEHLESPQSVLEKLFQLANQYLVIMVPLDDDLDIAEHVNRFSFDDFNYQYGKYTLCYHEWIYCGASYWPGYQLLLVYSKLDNHDTKVQTLSDFSGGVNEKGGFDKILSTVQEQSRRIEKADIKMQEMQSSAELLKEKNIQKEKENEILRQNNNLLQEENQELKNESENLQEKIEKIQALIDACEQENNAKQEKLKAADALLQKQQKHMDALTVLAEKTLREYAAQQQQAAAFMVQGTQYCEQMLNSSFFKMLHFWSRLKCQLLFGNVTEKIHFLRWLLHRPDEMADRRFQPLNSVYHTLQAALAVPSIQPFSLEERLAKEKQMEEAGVLKTIGFLESAFWEYIRNDRTRFSAMSTACGGGV